MRCQNKSALYSVHVFAATIPVTRTHYNKWVSTAGKSKQKKLKISYFKQRDAYRKRAFPFKDIYGQNTF